MSSLILIKYKKADPEIAQIKTNKNLQLLLVRNILA